MNLSAPYPSATSGDVSATLAAAPQGNEVYGPPNPWRRPPRPLRHQWFNPWLIARGESLKRLVQDVLQFVTQIEQRKRARKPDDLRNHLRAVEGLVCNLAHAVLIPPQPYGWLATPSRNGERGKGRYDNPAFGSAFRETMILLQNHGLLWRQISLSISGEVASIAPSGRFEAMVIAAGITLTDFAPDPAQEVIYVFRNTTSYTFETGHRSQKDRIDYSDTVISRSYRADLQALNAFLAEADIAFIADAVAPAVDPNQRILRRYFTVFAGEEVRFDRTGRLYGGFWQSISRERRSQIRIDGEAVADVDFQSMAQRLAYLELGIEPPDGDLYLVPPLEGYREGVKLAMNCLLFDPMPNRRQWPAAMGMRADQTSDAVSPKLPRGWTVNRTKRAILDKHPDLTKAWGRGLGYTLMWRESEILIAVLNSLMAQNVPALGLHDGLLVSMSKADVALQAMRECSKAIVGVELPCVRK